MLGESSSSLLAADSGSDAAAADGQDGGGVVERESGDRGSFGGNRWPRQETLALLKIRSEMDVAFRDSSSKGPLWEEISRKLAELGYHRSAKKCKEKFENVYKYHKRTREGRTGKQDGKNYPFFDQLEAFDSQPQALPVTPPAQQPRPTTMPLAAPSIAHVTTTSSTVPVTTTVHHINTLPQNITTSVNYLTIPSLPISNPTILPPMSMNPNPATNNNNHPSFPVMPKDIPLSNNSTSSSTFSDEGLRAGGGGGGRKRKRKWKDFFERLMREVMDKQEELQARFLEAIEKREHERIFREDSWRMQEMARINKERELLAQERSMAAAKDTAVMAFLQKLAEQQNPGKPHNTVANNNLNLAPSSQPPTAPPPPRPEPPPPPVLAPQPPPTLQTGNAIVEIRKTDNGDNLLAHQQTSSSRWPKVEVQALIQLRTNLDSKYQENGPKGPLWEEISGAMKRLGYDRSAKRCKEKWENINKYFKKVKESNKKRRDDAKTCPYFQQLDAIYKERSTKNMIDMTTPLMVTPEQQWHPQQDQAPRSDMVMDDIESDQMDHNLDDDPEDGDGDGDGDGDEDEDDGGEFEVVAASKPSSNGATQ